jgi:hypothetical protein
VKAVGTWNGTSFKTLETGKISRNMVMAAEELFVL